MPSYRSKMIRNESLTERYKKIVSRCEDDLETSKKIQELCSGFVLSNDDLKRVMKEMLRCIDDGLTDEPGVTSTLRMLPSFVREVPNGTEQGDYLALDLGGTNFRVLLIKLRGNKADMSGKIYCISDEKKKGTGTALFDHIADCLANLIIENNLNGTILPLGFTFSFACDQESLDCAKLVSWSKEFCASGVIGEDVAQLLREACKRRNDIKVDIAAVLNDTVGTLLACAFKENTCRVGIILGTGTNACYMEKLSNCPKLKKYKLDEDKLPQQIIINMEWGSFGEDGCLDFLLTPYDKDVDNATNNPKKELFEKMISGMYLGEVARCVLVDLAKRKLIFDGDYESISKPHSFATKYVSEIESDEVSDDDDIMPYQKTMDILEDLGIQNVSIADCIYVAYVCSIVSTRAAHLCAAGIAALLSRMQLPCVTVGIDGSLYRFHPTFGQLLQQKIDDLLEPNLDFQLMLSEDGSGRGAALVAAVATRMKKVNGICL